MTLVVNLAKSIYGILCMIDMLHSV